MNLVALPIVLPIATGVALLLSWRPGTIRRISAVASAICQAGFAVVCLALVARSDGWVARIGGWPAEFGIVLVLDSLSALMITLSSIILLACLLFAFAEQRARVEHPLRLPLLMLLLGGINLAFLTGDLFNLFVAFEMILIGSAALLTLEADDWEVKQAFPYLVLNQVGSALFLVAAAFAYGLFGSLNMAVIAERANAMQGDPRVTLLALLLLGVFLLKAGAFPLYYWLPHSYPILPSPIGAFYAALLTKVGVYAIARLYGTVFPPDLPVIRTLLVIAAAGTLLVGAFGAVSREHIRSVLSLLLTQIGFMLLALGWFGQFAFTAAIYYLVHHVLTMAALFMLGGVIVILNRTDVLRRAGNLGRAAPAVAVIFFLQALSLSGIPPFSGFWGKYMIIATGVDRGAWALVAAALITTFLSLFVSLRIWNAVFWREREDVQVHRDDARWKAMAGVAGGVTALSLWVGFGADFHLRLAAGAARAALDQPAYVERVLGGSNR